MNRRSVLAGIGALGIGGGALVASGAFTNVEAQRDVEVNVIDDEDISEFVDVLVFAGEYDSVDVLDDGGSAEDPTELFPDDDGDYTFDAEEYVSLIANDVTIRFGDGESGLLPNTTTNYDDLFRVVKTGDEPSEVDVELELEDGAEDFLSIDTPSFTVSDGDDKESDADVTTEEDDDDGLLTITLTEA